LLLWFVALFNFDSCLCAILTILLKKIIYFLFYDSKKCYNLTIKVFKATVKSWRLLLFWKLKTHFLLCKEFKCVYFKNTVVIQSCSSIVQHFSTHSSIKDSNPYPISLPSVFSFFFVFLLNIQYNNLSKVKPKKIHGFVINDSDITTDVLYAQHLSMCTLLSPPYNCGFSFIWLLFYSMYPTPPPQPKKGKKKPILA